MFVLSETVYLSLHYLNLNIAHKFFYLQYPSFLRFCFLRLVSSGIHRGSHQKRAPVVPQANLQVDSHERTLRRRNLRLHKSRTIPIAKGNRQLNREGRQAEKELIPGSRSRCQISSTPKHFRCRILAMTRAPKRRRVPVFPRIQLNKRAPIRTQG